MAVSFHVCRLFFLFAVLLFFLFLFLFAFGLGSFDWLSEQGSRRQS